MTVDGGTDCWLEYRCSDGGKIRVVCNEVCTEEPRTFCLMLHNLIADCCAQEKVRGARTWLSFIITHAAPKLM